jgi:large subunit ribosomal protein L13Ae
MVFEKRIVVDCKGHLLGRLASYVAKELLLGQRIVLVRCEEVNVSGRFMRNKNKFMAFLNKRCNTNPKLGPFHYRSPAMMVWRAVRGMLPHKSVRGQIALNRLKVFDGCPPPFDKMKRMVIPDALRVMRLAPRRKYIVLKDLAAQVGWKYRSIIEKLEQKRKLRAAAWYEKKKAIAKLRKQAAAKLQDKLANDTTLLQKHGALLS